MRVRFGRFLIDSGTRQLLRDGAEVHLPRKAFDLLATLVQERPRVLDKDELMRTVWPDSHVDAAGLNVLVGDVRRAIGDAAKTPVFIRTVHGVGFAFCGDAEDDEPAAAAPVAAWLVAGERTYKLSEGENAIGRDPRSAVWLDAPGVSRRHAALMVDPDRGTARLRDLGSTNGTFIGSRKVEGDVELADGDVVEVGSLSLTFRRWSPDKAVETRRIRRKAR